MLLSHLPQVSCIFDDAVHTLGEELFFLVVNGHDDEEFGREGRNGSSTPSDHLQLNVCVLLGVDRMPGPTSTYHLWKVAHPYISQRACGTWFRRSWSGPLASETNNATSSNFSSRRKGFCKKRSAEFEDEHSDNTRVRTGFFSRRHYDRPINISSHCVQAPV